MMIMMMMLVITMKMIIGYCDNDAVDVQYHNNDDVYNDNEHCEIDAVFNADADDTDCGFGGGDNDTDKGNGVVLMIMMMPMIMLLTKIIVISNKKNEKGTRKVRTKIHKRRRKAKISD